MRLKRVNNVFLQRRLPGHRPFVDALNKLAAERGVTVTTVLLDTLRGPLGIPSAGGTVK